jgi:uncharacterized coiled-coil DUF342 family protein
MTPNTTPQTSSSRPSLFWRNATVATIMLYGIFLIATMGFQVAAMLRSEGLPARLSAQDAASLAVEQADRILGLLEVVLGVVALILPLGLTVVVYIYNQSRATIEDNRTTIENLARQATAAQQDAHKSAEEVERLRKEVDKALGAAEDAIARDKERDAETKRLQARIEQQQRNIEKQSREVDVQRIEAEKRGEETELLRQMIQVQFAQMLEIQRHTSVLTLILEIRNYEVSLLSDNRDEVVDSLGKLIQYSLVDEEESESLDQHTPRRREAIHALATFCYTPYMEADWMHVLMQRLSQHLERLAKEDPVRQVRYEAMRVLRELNNHINGAKPAVPAAPTRRRSSKTNGDVPTQGD